MSSAREEVREVLDVESIEIRHDDGVFHGGPEFADISGPRVGEETGEGGIGEGFFGATVFAGKFAEEGIGEQDDVLFSFP